MNNEEKFAYAAYLGRIRWYYRTCSDPKKAIEYDTKAKQVFDEVKGYDSIKCNVVFGYIQYSARKPRGGRKKYPNDGRYVQSKSSRYN